MVKASSSLGGGGLKLSVTVPTRTSVHSVRSIRAPTWRSSATSDETNADREPSPSEDVRERGPSFGVVLAEKAEFLVQGALALFLAGALAISGLNILAKIGVITFALVSVAVRYTIVGA